MKGSVWEHLPCLLNAERGDLPMVDSRSITIGGTEQLATDPWSSRFMALLGLTGLWLWYGQGISARQRALEIAYAKHNRLVGDIITLFRTACTYLFGQRPCP